MDGYVIAFITLGAIFMIAKLLEAHEEDKRRERLISKIKGEDNEI